MQKVAIMGGLYAKVEIGRLLLEDIQRTLPLAVLAALLVAWASFRTWYGVWVPALTTIIAVTWTLGFIAAIGVSLNLMTILIPTLVLVVGFAYAVHVVSEYNDVLAMRVMPKGSARGTGFDVKNRGAIFGVGAAVAVIAILGTSQIHVSTDFIDRNTVLYRSAQVLNEHLQGSNAFYVVLETDFDGAFKEPENLLELRAFQDWLQAQPEIGGATSLVDSLMIINRGFHGGALEFLAIPESRSLVSQLLFFGAIDELERFVDSRYRTARSRSSRACERPRPAFYAREPRADSPSLSTNGCTALRQPDGDSRGSRCVDDRTGEVGTRAAVLNLPVELVLQSRLRLRPSASCAKSRNRDR